MRGFSRTHIYVFFLSLHILEKTVLGLVATEIKVLFLKLTVALNLNFKVIQIMDKNGTLNARILCKPLTDILLIIGC